MKELIKIEEKEGKQTVNARELHSFLNSKQDFSTWMKNRIKKYGFMKNTDYACFQEKKRQITQQKLNTIYLWTWQKF